MNKDPQKRICDGCRKLIRDKEGRRNINGFALHLDDYCFFLYTEKVKNGILKTGYVEKRRVD
jgi:hypothetical protein